MAEPLVDAVWQSILDTILKGAREYLALGGKIEDVRTALEECILEASRERAAERNKLPHKHAWHPYPDRTGQHPFICLTCGVRAHRLEHTGAMCACRARTPVDKADL